MHEGANEGPGILTTNATKEMMCVAVQELLDTNRLVLFPRMICTSLSPREVLDTLLKQLRAYNVVVEPAKNAFGKAKRTYSGKIAGQQDDVCVALQLSVLCGRIFLRSDRYSIYRR